ncbi:unnamed protein product [Dicrocoelium dendriticum]|nr:unnamed protein product [Dicrocoelium dendriticum]
MSTTLSGQSLLPHDVNPYIPDLIRPHSASYLHLYSRHNPHERDNVSSRFSPDEHALKQPPFLPTVTAAQSHLKSSERLPSQHPLPGQSSTLASPTNTVCTPPSCAKCHKQILDHYLCRILDQTWHEKCAICSICSACLTDVCFFHEGQLFCRRDYDRLHAVRCANCRQPMRSHELFMCAQTPRSADQINPPTELIFHVSCFTCSVCQQPLAVGDAYTVDAGSNRLICRADFLASRSRTFSVQSLLSSAGSPSLVSRSVLPKRLVSGYECSDNSSSNFHPSSSPGADLPSNGYRSNGTTTSMQLSYTHLDRGIGCSKRVRTSLTEEQRFHLQKAYEQSSRPSKHARECLAKQLSVPVRVVQVWFQNQRARDKRALSQQHCQNHRPHSNWTIAQENHPAASSTDASLDGMTGHTSVQSGLADFSLEHLHRDVAMNDPALLENRAQAYSSEVH